MDGYALRARDARAAPASGSRSPSRSSPAAPHPGPLPAGACCRIFTGAPLPEGADAVEQQEQVRRAGRSAAFLRGPRCGAGSCARAARTWRPGASRSLRARRSTRAPSRSRRASAGPSSLVHRRPRVAILPTGDELVPVGRTPAPGQIVETNGHALAAAAREAGAEPVLLPAAGDDAASLRRALAAARGADALVTSGGVSVGARDLVRAALAAAGARLEFWRVAMRPGKPFTFGRWGRTAVFGLPGNPVSALVTFELFARPALRTLAGLPGSGRLRVRGTARRRAGEAARARGVRTVQAPRGPRRALRRAAPALRAPATSRPPPEWTPSRCCPPAAGGSRAARASRSWSCVLRPGRDPRHVRSVGLRGRKSDPWPGSAGTTPTSSTRSSCSRPRTDRTAAR